MSADAKVVKPVTGNSSLVRPRYSPGLLLRDDDLNQGVDYTRNLSRLLFRSLFGCGVVCGLNVKPALKCDKLILTVADGVALDCHGDPVHVPEPQVISIDPTCGIDIPQGMWVVLRRIEKHCAPRAAACSCDDEETPAMCTRERDGFEIRILSGRPKCACGCKAKVEPENTAKEKAPREQPKSTRRKESPPIEDTQAQTPQDCRCADPTVECYEDHYQGRCGCECSDCDCEWIVLAAVRAVKAGTDEDKWEVDHSVRRFVRPVLMRDPVAWAEAHPESP